MGRDIARLNDVDGDKCDDLAIADGGSMLWLISGKSGTVLASEQSFRDGIATLGGDADGDGLWDLVTFGSDLAIRSGRDLKVIQRNFAPEAQVIGRSRASGIGDWDGDGKPDVGLHLSSRNTAVLFFSSSSGKLLEPIPGESELRVGAPLACADFDHDGAVDLIVATDPERSSAQSCLVRVTRTKPSVQSLDIPDECALTGFSECVGVVPDADGDGWDDVLVVHPMRGIIAGKAVVYSSRDGKLVRTLGHSYLDAMCDGVTVANLDDIDRDGVSDFAISYDRWWDEGRCVVYSGKTGKELREHKGSGANLFSPGRYAVTVVALGDTDGDGTGDYAVGASGGIDGLGAGCVSVYSGRSGTLLHAFWKRNLEKR